MLSMKIQFSCTVYPTNKYNYPPMLWVTVLSLSSSSPRAISSVFIHRIILQRDSGRPAAQPTDTIAGRRDSLPAFPWTVSGRADDEQNGRWKMGMLRWQAQPLKREKKGMQQGKLAQDVTAQHKCWRCGDVRERGCVRLGGADVLVRNRCEYDEGLMLKLLRLWLPQLQGQAFRRAMQSTGCR